MKRKTFLFLSILLISFTSSLFSSDVKNYNLSNKTNSGCYHIRCYKCEEYSLNNRGYGMCMGCPAWKTHLFKNINNEKCIVYRCQHGHTLYVSIESTKRM